MGFEISGLLSNIDKGPFTLFVPTDRAFNEYLLNVMGGVSKGLARMERNKSELYQVCYTIFSPIFSINQDVSPNVECSKSVSLKFDSVLIRSWQITSSGVL